MYKDHELYYIYELYISSKRIPIGAKRLLKISESSFDNFKYQYLVNLTFKEIIDRIIMVERRNYKIESIIG